MTERKNVQMEHKWAGQLPSDGGIPFYLTDRHLKHVWGNPNVENATLHDSPSDVPDDCTPVRVRVETWEEEGEPEPWDFGDRKPDGYRKCYVDAGGELWDSEKIVTPEVVKQWLKNVPQDDIHTARTAIPVRIPTETKREVTLDPEPEFLGNDDHREGLEYPEPTETGCRCREVVDEMLEYDPKSMAGLKYVRGWFDALGDVRRALSNCDCKSEADDE